MSILVSFILIAFVALSAFLSYRKAKKRSWSAALIRTGVIVLAAVISVLLAKAVGSICGSLVGGAIVNGADAGVEAFFDSVPVARESLQAIVAVVVAPTLFIPIFLLLRWLIGLLTGLLKFRHDAFQRTEESYVAGSIGAVNGVLIALVTLIPICGLITTVATASNAFFNETDVKKTEMYLNMTDGGNTAWATVELVTDSLDDGLVSTVSSVGEPVYRWLTTTDLMDGQLTFSLSDEITHFSKTLGNFMCAGDAFSGDFSDDDKDTLSLAGDTLMESDWIAEFGAEILSYMGEQWRDGDTMMGMEAPETPALVQPTMLVVYDILATEDVTTIRGDLSTMLDIIGTLAANGFFNEESASTDLLARLADRTEDEDGFTLQERMKATLEGNRHLSPLAAEIDAVTGRVVSSVLGAELRDNERYAPVVSSVAGRLNEALTMNEADRQLAVQSAVKDAFETEGIVVPEDVAMDMAEGILSDCGTDGEITDDEVREHMANRIENDDATVIQIIEENDLSAFLTNNS